MSNGLDNIYVDLKAGVVKTYTLDEPAAFILVNTAPNGFEMGVDSVHREMFYRSSLTRQTDIKKLYLCSKEDQRIHLIAGNGDAEVPQADPDFATEVSVKGEVELKNAPEDPLYTDQIAQPVSSKSIPDVTVLAGQTDTIALAAANQTVTEALITRRDAGVDVARIGGTGTGLNAGQEFQKGDGYTTQAQTVTIAAPAGEDVVVSIVVEYK